MDTKYFERLHVEEARRGDWRLLDESLQARTFLASRRRRLKVATGHAMMRIGAWLAGEPLEQRTLGTCVNP